MKTIKEQYDSYVEDVMPTTAGAAQRQETRRAFYAGATAAISLVLEIGESMGAEDGGNAVDDLCGELAAFNKAVKEGNA